MTLLSVNLDSENEKIYFHHPHITRSLPIKTGYDQKWYVVAKNYDHLVECMTDEIAELCELDCFGIWDNNAVNTHYLIKVLKENNIHFSELNH